MPEFKSKEEYEKWRAERMQQNQEKLKTKKVMETENKESMRPRINPILAIASFVVLSIFLVKLAVFDAFWIIILFLVGCITGIIADNKGRDFWGWWFFGILFFILALPLVLVLKPDEKALVEKGIKKKCPQCAELVKTEAVKCRYCGHEF